MNEQIKHLEKLLNELKDMEERRVDNNINKLIKMVDSEIEPFILSCVDLKDGTYYNDLHQTKNEELADLIDNISKPKKRKSKYDDAHQAFEHDINNEIRRLRTSESDK